MHSIQVFLLMFPFPTQIYRHNFLNFWGTTVEGVRENYDLLYQNSIKNMKMTQGYILSYFFTLHSALSLFRILAEVSLTCIFHHMLKQLLNLWSSHSQRMNSIQIFYLILPFPTPIYRQNFMDSWGTTAERGGKNYDLLYQNSIRKYEDDLQYQIIYILYDLQLF